MPLSLPASGRPWDYLRTEMEGMREHDLDWRHGRHGAYVWYADDPLEDVLREAFGMFMVENGLGVRSFPSIGRMEREVLSMVAGLLGGGDETAGIFTSGGTESIFLAVYAMREKAMVSWPRIDPPEIIAPYSAHPALSKAAHYLGLTVKRIPVGPDHRADVRATEAAITDRTVGLYASAPSYSLGIIDPVAELGEMAEREGLWLHVDACVGGILAPFVRKLGYAVPSFDFANPGVSSISADLHKSGYAAKPASTVTFRRKELHRFARYAMSDWPSGTYSSHTFTGSRPGGAIAAAWAGMNYLGVDGYTRIAASAMRAKERIAHGITQIEGVHIHGEPRLWSFAFGADDIDWLKVATLMHERGWMCGITTSPPGIHVMATPVHEPYADEYVAAIAECVAQLRGGAAAASSQAAYN